MSDTVQLPQWSEIEPFLQEHGVMTERLAPHHKLMIQRMIREVLMIQHMLREDNDIGDGYDLSSIGDEDWDVIAGNLIDIHPLWESLMRRRLRHAEELIDNWAKGDFGLSDPKELAKHRFAAITWYDQNSGVHSAGDTDTDLCAFYIVCTNEMEDPESIDHIVDLDSGEVYATANDFSLTVTCSLFGSESTRQFR